jgi:hypothetical protein
MSNWKRWIMVSGVVAGLGGAAVADDGGGAGARRERAHSINVNGGRALLGEYVVNYEYLAGHHGAIVEGGAAHDADGATSATTFGAAAGYRLHWRGRQNSGFVGVMAGFYVGSAATTTGGDDPMAVDLTVTELSLTANVGKRWQLANGLNVTWRIGGGYARRWVSTSSDDPDVAAAAQTVEDVLAFLPIAVDGELSLGYSF